MKYISLLLIAAAQPTQYTAELRWKWSFPPHLLPKHAYRTDCSDCIYLLQWPMCQANRHRHSPLFGYLCRRIYCVLCIVHYWAAIRQRSNTILNANKYSFVFIAANVVARSALCVLWERMGQGEWKLFAQQQEHVSDLTFNFCRQHTHRRKETEKSTFFTRQRSNWFVVGMCRCEATRANDSVHMGIENVMNFLIEMSRRVRPHNQSVATNLTRSNYLSKRLRWK